MAELKTKKAVKRGNYQIRRVEAVPSIETWIHTQLNDARFASFMDRVEPWVDGGYGLYRDCE